MKSSIRTMAIVALLTTPLALAGCGKDAPAEKAPPADKGRDDHAHGDEGPHGGHLIELGRDHQYHAELVEDDAAKAVTIYILDGKQKPITINAETITLSLTADGNTVSHEFAVVTPANAAGSQFASTDSAAFDTMHEHHDIQGTLRVTINGDPYVGELEHHEH